jgi:hypothetical protein
MKHWSRTFRLSGVDASCQFSFKTDDIQCFTETTTSSLLKFWSRLTPQLRWTCKFYVIARLSSFVATIARAIWDGTSLPLISFCYSLSSPFVTSPLCSLDTGVSTIKHSLYSVPLSPCLEWDRVFVNLFFYLIFHYRSRNYRHAI